jgi:nicotinate phosphoribosyltransferase
MAHEYLQACQQLAPKLETSEQFGFNKWIEEYGDQLATALSDVYHRYVFINDLNRELCQKFHGFRQDSGDPYSWGDLMIEHLKHQGIDPKDKSLVFSDSLNFEKMANITEYFYQRTNPLFGIGTYLTNDVGISPIEIIIKMVACNGKPVGKLTDDPHKTVCPDKAFLKTLRNTFGYYEDARQHN